MSSIVFKDVTHVYLANKKVSGLKRFALLMQLKTDQTPEDAENALKEFIPLSEAEFPPPIMMHDGRVLRVLRYLMLFLWQGPPPNETTRALPSAPQYKAS